MKGVCLCAMCSFCFQNASRLLWTGNAWSARADAALIERARADAVLIERARARAPARARASFRARKG